MNYARIASVIFTSVFVLSTIAGLLSAVPMQAQVKYVWAPGYTYPGSILPVTVYVPVSGVLVTVTVTNALTGEKYAEQAFYAPSPGNYTVNIPIPKKLPNIGTADPPTLLVTANIPLVGPDTTTVEVYPLIEIIPTSSTIVDPLGNGKTVTVTGYGFAKDTSATAVNFIGLGGQGSYSYSGVWKADSYGVIGPITIDLLKDLTGYGIPAGQYKVTLTSTAVRIDKASTPVFTVIPQLVILDREGNGRDVDPIRINGYGFPANTTIVKITLSNTNFTKVVYTFTVNTSSNKYGYVAQINLKDVLRTNMSAGLYIPTVYYSDGTNITFRNTYHLVRPILCYVIGGVPQCYAPAPILKPGQKVTIVAYGYGPGANWGYPVNILYVSFDKIHWLGNFTLGKDGNVTFTITIPGNATFGSHYIWGVDIWGYEYSLAIIVGGKAYWVALRGLDKSILKDTKVSAGYPVKGVSTVITACPCTKIAGYGYCAECVIYGGECDYLGDYIRVVVTGLNPGESYVVYFKDILVGSGTADKNGYGVVEFVVPTLPQGNYNITVVGTLSGTISVPWYFDPNIYAASIYPKILTLSLSGNYLPVIVGSGIVRFLGTGFPPGAAFAGLLVNNTDALLAVTTNVMRWSANSSGVLVGWAGTVPAVWIPMMHPGKYELRLAYIVGTTPYKSAPSYVYVVNNISRLVTIDNLNAAVNTITGLLNSISSKIDSVSSSIASLSGKVDTINTKVDTISSKVDTIISKVDAVSSAVKTVSGKVDTLLSKIDTVSSKIDAVSSKVDAVSKAVSDVSSKVDAVSAAVKAVSDKVDALSSKVDTIGSKVDSVASKVDTVSSAVKTVSDKVDALSSKVDAVSAAVSTVGSKVDAVSSAVNTVSGKVDTVSTAVKSVSDKVDAVSSAVGTVSSKADTAIAAASNAFYTGIVAVIFALLATIFALLGYYTVRKSLAPK